MKTRYVKRILKKVSLILAIITIFLLIFTKFLENHFETENQTYELQGERSNVEIVTDLKQSNIKSLLDYELDLTQFYNINVPFRLPEPKGPKRDWHDYAAMENDRRCVGLGEHGLPAYIEVAGYKNLEKEISLDNGFNALLSDLISVNRSLPDVRKKGCRHRQYSAYLPTASVVIPFHNEYFSTLQRTLYSIINRTPSELLHEIIIVDDYSDREYLKQQLDDFVTKYMKDIVKIIRLPKRMGLIGARLAGARKATGDVLVFFDSHIECNYNWLPPLLEPIAINRRISTCPIIDVIDHATFAYKAGQQEGGRGAFDWNLVYKQMPVLPVDSVNKTLPYRNPIMMGGLFAISRDFFWELGGYDEGLSIWGAEQYELSFKIWMCGGLLCDVPCSRVAHVFRGPMNDRVNPRKYGLVAKNHKRLAEVWMDEYAQYVYDHQPQTYINIDAGDLTKQIAIRKNLKCKPFKWFIENIAPDLIKNYPPMLPPGYASGAIQSLAYPDYCLDTLGGENGSALKLQRCNANKTLPLDTQHWTLSHFRDIRLFKSDICLDVYESHQNATIWIWDCHNSGGNQFWSYDKDEKMIAHGLNRDVCIEAFVENDKPAVFVNPCDKFNPRMKWIFGTVNETALENFWNDV